MYFHEVDVYYGMYEARIGLQVDFLLISEKSIGRYLRRMTKVSMYFGVGSYELVCYNDWAGDIDTQRFTSGYLVNFYRESCILGGQSC